MTQLLEDKVDFKTLVRTEPQRVYQALTTATGLDQWFTTGCSLDPRPGGRIVFRWKDWGAESYTGEIPGKVIEMIDPRRFVFQWRADSGTYDTTVEVDFLPVAEGTIVHLIEYGYQDTVNGKKDLLNRVAGWAQVLTLLKFYIEHGVTY